MDKTPRNTSSLAEACENCKFGRVTAAADKQLILTCNYNPPIVSQALIATPQGPQWMANTQLPVVPRDCWCGRYERNIAGSRN